MYQIQANFIILGKKNIQQTIQIYLHIKFKPPDSIEISLKITKLKILSEVTIIFMFKTMKIY